MPRLIIIAILLCILPVCAVAAERVLEAEHVYVLGENDTRAEARRICLLEAKRKLVEEVGTWVQSRTEVGNLQLTQDQIRTFSSAFVRVEDSREEFFMSGQAFAVRVWVRAAVDPEALAPRLVDYASRPDARARLTRLADQDGMLRDEALAPGAAAPVRERALRSLEELEAEKARLLEETQRLGQAAQAVVSAGMTEEEVVSLLGPPRVKKVNTAMAVTYACHNYGKVWVVFRDGLVACTRSRLSWRQDYGGDCHCAGSPTEVFFK